MLRLAEAARMLRGRWSLSFPFAALIAGFLVFQADGCGGLDDFVTAEPVLPSYRVRDSTGPFEVKARIKGASSHKKPNLKLWLYGTNLFWYDTSVCTLTVSQNRLIDSDSSHEGCVVNMYVLDPQNVRDTGDHYIQAEYRDSSHTILWGDTTEVLFTGGGGGGGGGDTTLRIWSGNHTYGSPGESIAPYRTYDLWVQLVDSADSGIDGQEIYFTVDNLNDASVSPPMTNTHYTFVDGVWGQKYHGLAGATLVFNEQAQNDCRVTAKWNHDPEPAESVMFDVHLISEFTTGVGDAEVPPNNNLNLWEKRCEDSLIRGDGLWLNDTNNDTLDLFVEIGYDPDIVDASDIYAAIPLLQDIYRPIGVEVSVTVDPGDESIPNTFGSQKEMRGCLHNHRSDTALIGLGRGAVHAMICGDYGDTLGGLTILCDYETDLSMGAAWSIPNGWGSWDSGTNARLDSCGVMVFGAALRDTSAEWTVPRLLAMTLGHELGHAIGLQHEDDSLNLMHNRPPFDPHDPQQTWAVMTRFTQNTWKYYFANLRHLLGRETVNPFW